MSNPSTEWSEYARHFGTINEQERQKAWNGLSGKQRECLARALAADGSPLAASVNRRIGVTKVAWVSSGIFLAIIGVVTVSTVFVHRTWKTATESLTTPSGSAGPAGAIPKTKDKFIDEVKREFDGLKTFNGSKFHDSQDGVLLEINLFDQLAHVVDEAGGYKLDQKEKRVVASLRSRLSALQSREFPSMRKAWAQQADRIMWEHDVRLQALGPGYRNLEITGAIFAANKNVKDAQEKWNDIISQLRFEENRYKWFSGAETFPYYKLDPVRDEVIAIWGGGAYHRVP